MICYHKTPLPNAAQIDIPSLDLRRSELPRIVSEYIEDATYALHAADDCLDQQDIEWILDGAAFGGELTISGIEKATLRAVALKMIGDLTGAARLLGMSRVALERWIRPRNGRFYDRCWSYSSERRGQSMFRGCGERWVSYAARSWPQRLIPSRG